MSPSGAVRAGPPAAQANRTANFNAHEYNISGAKGLTGPAGIQGPESRRRLNQELCELFGKDLCLCRFCVKEQEVTYG
mgnify:CR=1 FL=1